MDCREYVRHAAVCVDCLHARALSDFDDLADR
jgi:hypothetical protein